MLFFKIFWNKKYIKNHEISKLTMLNFRNIQTRNFLLCNTYLLIANDFKRNKSFKCRFLHSQRQVIRHYSQMKIPSVFNKNSLINRNNLSHQIIEESQIVQKEISDKLLNLYKRLPNDKKEIYSKYLIENNIDYFFIHSPQIDNSETWIRTMSHLVEINDEERFKKISDLFFQRNDLINQQYLVTVLNLELKLIGNLFGFENAMNHWKFKFQSSNTIDSIGTNKPISSITEQQNKNSSLNTKNNQTKTLEKPISNECTVVTLLELAIHDPSHVKQVLETFSSSIKILQQNSDFMSLLALYNWNQNRHKKALQLILSSVYIGRNRKGLGYENIFIPIQSFHRYCPTLTLDKLQKSTGSSKPSLFTNKIICHIMEDAFRVNEDLLKDEELCGDVFMLINHLLYHMTVYKQFEGYFYSSTINEEIADSVFRVASNYLKEHRLLWRAIRKLYNHPFSTHWGPLRPTAEIWVHAANAQRAQKFQDGQLWHDDVFKYSIQQMLTLFPTRQSRQILYQMLFEMHGSQAINLFHFEIPIAIEYAKFYLEHGTVEGSAHIRFYMRQHIKSMSLKNAIHLLEIGKLEETHYNTPTTLF